MPLVASHLRVFYTMSRTLAGLSVYSYVTLRSVTGSDLDLNDYFGLNGNFELSLIAPPQNMPTSFSNTNSILFVRTSPSLGISIQVLISRTAYLAIRAKRGEEITEWRIL